MASGCSSGGSGERALVYLYAGSQAIGAPLGRNTTPIIRSTRTLQIRHLHGLLLDSLLDLTAPGSCYLKLGPIFMTSRWPQALTGTFAKIYFEGFLS
jgi:hypothetical protein